MPSLVAFGRRWNISSDDFVFPELTEAFFRIGWVIFVVIIFILPNPFHCTSWQWFFYMAGMLLINIISAIFCFAIAINSAKGSILETNARRSVITLLYIRVPIFGIEIILTIASTILCLGFFVPDLCFFLRGFQLVVFLQWFLIGGVIFGIFLVFNPQGGHNVEQSIMIQRKYWRRRLTLFHIRQDLQMRAALDEIASLIASFFADNDFVMSDIVAGLLLLVHSPHKTPPCKFLKENRSEDTDCDSNYPEWMKLPDCLPTVSRMLEFAVAIYGWPTFMVNNCSCTSWYRLCCRLRCFQKCISDRVIIVDDNCCSCHTSTFVLEAQVDETDIFMISVRNRLFQVPFVVLTDHRTQSIVIAIRGSASLLDIVTDLSLNEDLFSVNVESDPILCEDHDVDNGARVHRGMLKGAHYVYDVLKRHNVLEDLKILNPDYTIVVCGHSLGAGIATLLTLLLKHIYSNIRCYAFSPPGCVISENGLSETESHVFSVFVGDDFVPRMSVQSIKVLKAAIDKEIYSTNKAKYEILIKGIFKLFFASSWKFHSSRQLLIVNNRFLDAEYDPTSSISTRDCRRLIGNRENYGTQERDLENLSDREVSYPNSIINNSEEQKRSQLRPPSKRLLRLENTPEGKVELRWVSYKYLEEIQLTGAIFTDHLPYKVRKIIRKALEQQHLNV